MGITAGMGALFSGLAGGVSSIFAGNAKSQAAQAAGQTQANFANAGGQYISGVMNTQSQQQAPFMLAGQTSLGTLMNGIQNGTFGSPMAAPQYQGGAFTAPTAAQAAATPGYQFTAAQGSKGILEGAAAAGGAISGGTLKALDTYNQGLASTTYGNTFNQSLASYNAGLAQYQAQLQGYGANLQGNQQAFSQLFAPSQLGEQATNALNNNLMTGAEGVASEYNNQGNALAAGMIGSTNQQWNGIQSGLGQIMGGMNSLGGLTNSGSFNAGAQPGFNGSNIYSDYSPPALNLGTSGPGAIGSTPIQVAAPPVGPAPSTPSPANGYGTYPG